MRIKHTFNRFSILVLATLVLAACGKQEAPVKKAVPEVGVMQAEMTPVPIVSTLPGRTSAYLDAEVRARVDGIVLRRYFVEGSDVRAGQLLYQIDPAPYIASLDSAKAALQKAQANLVSAQALAKRYKVLVKANAVSRQQYDDAVAAQGQAVADVASAKAAVATAKINLGYTKVVAPISGRIGISQVTPGAYAQAGQATLMATIQQLNPVYVDLTQSSLDGLKLRQDVASGKVKTDGPAAAKVTLYLEDGTVYSEKGKLQFSDVSVDPGTGSVTLRAIFPNKQSLLLPGMYVTAKVEEGINEKAFLIPQTALTRNQKGEAVLLVVNQNGQIEQRTVQTTAMQGSNWVVEGGLNPGDLVVLQRSPYLFPGMPVKTHVVDSNGVPIEQPDVLNADELSADQSQANQPDQQVPQQPAESQPTEVKPAPTNATQSSNARQQSTAVNLTDAKQSAPLQKLSVSSPAPVSVSKKAAS